MRAVGLNGCWAAEQVSFFVSLVWTLKATLSSTLKSFPTGQLDSKCPSCSIKFVAARQSSALTEILALKALVAYVSSFTNQRASDVEGSANSLAWHCFASFYVNGTSLWRQHRVLCSGCSLH